MAREMESEEEFRKELAAGSGLVVVEFFATWCVPCKRIGPVVDQWSVGQFSSSKFIKVDVDKLDRVAESCGVSAMPTFQFYKNGSKVAELLGDNEAMLKERIESHQ